MRAVIQRVKQASVIVDGAVVGEIGHCTPRPSSEIHKEYALGRAQVARIKDCSPSGVCRQMNSKNESLSVKDTKGALLIALTIYLGMATVCTAEGLIFYRRPEAMLRRRYTCSSSTTCKEYGP
jgi:hypothetical protein